MTIRNRIITAGLGLNLLGTTLAAQAYSGEQYTKEAKISSTTARATALKAFHGKIVKEKLVHGRGGSGLRYAFDIRHGHVTHDVGWTPRRVSF